MNETAEDQARKKAIERANAYREMMNLWAWKDLMNELEGIRQDALMVIDAVPFEQNAALVIAESRGERRGLQKLLNRIDFVLSGGAGGVQS